MAAASGEKAEYDAATGPRRSAAQPREWQDEPRQQHHGTSDFRICSCSMPKPGAVCVTAPRRCKAISGAGDPFLYRCAQTAQNQPPSATPPGAVRIWLADSKTARSKPMAATGLEVFDKTLQTTNTWLDEVMETTGPDRHVAWHALTAVLHTLRDRLPVDLSAHLGAQLPLLIRGAYYDQWHPAGQPDRVRSAEDSWTGWARRWRIRGRSIFAKQPRACSA
jgi:hypothetical protein